LLLNANIFSFFDFITSTHGPSHCNWLYRLMWSLALAFLESVHFQHIRTYRLLLPEFAFFLFAHGGNKCHEINRGCRGSFLDPGLGWIKCWMLQFLEGLCSS
jgi:hypothetical protein